MRDDGNGDEERKGEEEQRMEDLRERSRGSKAGAARARNQRPLKTSRRRAKDGGLERRSLTKSLCAARC